jgi:2-amino-4-hydroxy-6-hydroxymethyldihydropteridine diphosphokinase/dihydropteroate synthase
MISRIVFGLGSNLGNRLDNINNAVKYLENLFNLSKVKFSNIIENKAILLPNSPQEWDLDFLNIVISADIDIERFKPLEILNITQEIEKKIGRVQSQRWSPRVIDIDILAIDDYIIKIDEILTIPHLGIFDRDFFINGFKEIESNLYEILLKKI